MKKIISLALMAMTLLPASVLAQESEFKAYVQADLVSRYIWRGSDLAGISIQPEVGISWKGLSLSAFGSAGFDRNDPEEIDITLGYEYKGFNAGITDYWVTGTDYQNRYFFFKDKETAHQLEANLGYTCPYFSLQAYTMFWGNDYKINGNRAYSTFVEVSVPFRAAGLDWDARVGITPMESAGYETITTVKGIITQNYVIEKHYFYGEGFTCNMASLRATKTLGFKNFEVPVFAEFHANPYLQKAYFLAGVRLKVF